MLKYPLYRLKWKLNPKLHRVGDFPLHLDIESTNACNLKCPMCMREWMKDDIGYMDANLYYKIIKEANLWNLSSLKLNWRGEPLLHKQLPEMIAIAKEKGVIDIQINTNGQLLTKDLMLKFKKFGLNRLIVSIDGATAGTYENIRRGGSFKRLIENLEIYKDLNRPFKLRIQICPLPENITEIDLWKKSFMRYTSDLRIGKRFNPQNKARFDQKDSKETFCGQFWQRLIISWNGQVYPCCADYLGKQWLGDARYESIYNIWHSDKMNLLREQMKRFNRNTINICATCDAYCH